jgi:putative FmdB family regulatory protein
MPFYEYQCTNKDCEVVTEKLRKVADRDDFIDCPKCGTITKKKVSQSSFQLKGGGWYSDGYSG